MFTTLVSAAALSLLAARGAMADFSVSSTAFTQCASTHITWSGTSNPVNILVVPAENPCDDTLADLGDHTQASMSWNVSLPAGTQLLISLEDSDGEEAWSDAITVQPSSDVSCLSAAQRAALPAANSTVSASASAHTSASASKVVVASSATTIAPESTAVAVVTATDADSAAPAVTAGALGAANAGIGPSESSAAGMNRAPLALAGVLALAGAALL